MKIGYIGLGNMGQPMVINLVKAGYDVTVFDLVPERLEPAVAVGATAAESGEAVAAIADILFTSLPEPRHSRAAMPSLIDAMQAGTIWVDLTTNDKELVLELAARAKSRGIDTLESPVTGAVDGARLGKLTLFVGGDQEVIERARAPIEVMGKLIACGPIGNGNVVKLITNQIWFVNAAVTGEALALGKKNGVDLLVLWDALKNSVGDTFVMRHDVPSIFAGHYDPSFSLALCCKDLRLLTELGEVSGTQLDMTKAAQAKFELARETYGDNAPELLVAKLVEEASNTSLQVEGEWQNHWEV